ncbi:MAG: asparagine synthetase B [Candidatus Krumholzibacteriota bacterium]|nr:asparagine synthetase B [Candidatus Krumholzibacteriota bacterium]
MKLLITVMLALSLGLFLPQAAYADYLVPMDLSQTNHLKAYGLVYKVLERGGEAKWLLNYRGGSFLLPEIGIAASRARAMGVEVVKLSGSEIASIYGEIEQSNMETVLLEQAPKVAVYAPPDKQPWDDAVMLVLEYSEIPYDVIYDREVLTGKLGNYDWLHLHHEDFTGQYGKFYASYRRKEWYIKQQIIFERRASSLGFDKVSEEKKAVARAIKEYVRTGGFLFAMCSGCDSFDIALAARGIDIVPREFDHDGMTPDCQNKLDYENCLAFEGFTLITNPHVYEYSDIDMTETAAKRSEGNDFFTLFEFSAKHDPVPTMLVQNHVSVIKGFMGQTTSFKKSLIKDRVLILGQVKGKGEARYIHGNFAKGTFTFLGGHDPEDYKHFVGDLPTRLERYTNSPGYRLILNNILFPAAEKKEQKT